MSILDRLHSRHNINRNTSVRLTQEGREKAIEFTGNPDSRILVALESIGSSADMGEIATESRLPIGQIERILPILINRGLVQNMDDNAYSMD